MNYSLIKKKIDEIKVNKINRFYKTNKKYNYKEFIDNLKNEKFVLQTIQQLSEGVIFIIKNSFDIKFIENTKNTLSKFFKEDYSINPKMIDGIKNGHYISNNLSESGYRTVDKSFYFFSWNEDKSGIYSNFINIYKPFKVLNGLKDDEFSNNIPSDGIIERLHVINYPIGSGEISEHFDPINISVMNFGIYGTEYGVDYSSGGFYVMDNKKKLINLDKFIRKTDIVVFFPGLIHCVKPISKPQNLEKNSYEGRWFFNINLVESHHVKNRQFTTKYKV